jgi:hypothetical protein
MSFLGVMLVRRFKRSGKVGVYLSQDNRQVLGVLTLLVPLIKAQYPNITEISIQSDNVSCLASHDVIAYIQHLSKELEGLGLTVVKWIYIEAHTGKGQLDTHFAFVDTVFQSYIESGKEIRTEQQIHDALCCNAE